MANTAASTLITRCLDNLSRAGVGVTRSGTTLSTKGIDWLNAAMRKIANAYDFQELYTSTTQATADGTKTYAFPTDYNTIFSLRLRDGTSSIKLMRVPSRELDRFYARPEEDAEDKPVWYIPYGDNYELYPIPDAVYTIDIRYALAPTVVTATTDLISYVPFRDDVIVASMTSEGFKMYQMYEDATFWENEFQRILKEQINSAEDYSDLDLQGRGFDSQGFYRLSGEYWNNPLIADNRRII